MAISGYDMVIHCYFVPRMGHQPEQFKASGLFDFKCSLAGHTNAVRDLSFIQTGDVTYMASCAQDTTIRIWKV
jgi:WD40 repeat protein